jgi:ribosomal protein S18 acetylase RimI-like enzyme
MCSAKPETRSRRIRIRPARLADLDALMELEQSVFTTDRLSRRSMRRLITSPSAGVVVAMADDRLAGAAMLLFRRRATVARLYSIGVVPQMSGQGVASALLAAIERAALRGGCRCVRLEVHETNRAAIARYRKSGYRQIGRKADYYEDGGDALRFEKPLGVSPSR